MKTIEFITPEPQHLPELGRICFEAFRSIHDRHGFPRDFPDVETAIKVVSLLGRSPEVFGVAARAEGRLVGSNFLLHTDSVAGVGPITVAPDFQGNGLGRDLMQTVLAQAAQRGLERVRLLQDSFNTASLSLYASLGFDVREPIAVMRAPAATKGDATIRLGSATDAAILAEPGRQFYKVSRCG
jgi:GNAT superfamily N-acetyltransferase